MGSYAGVILWGQAAAPCTFCAGGLLGNAYKNHQTYVRKTDENGPKVAQNLSKIDPGGGLEASWELSLKQSTSKTSLLIILGPFWDPLGDQFGVILGIMF